MQVNHIKIINLRSKCEHYINFQTLFAKLQLLNNLLH